MGQCWKNKEKKPALYVKMDEMTLCQPKKFMQETKTSIASSPINSSKLLNVQLTLPNNNTTSSETSITTPQDLINDVFGGPPKNISKKTKLDKIITEETNKYLTTKSKFIKMSSERLIKMNPEPAPTHKRTKSSIVNPTKYQNNNYNTTSPILTTKIISPEKQPSKNISSPQNEHIITIIPKLILPITNESIPPKVKKLTYYKTYEHSDLFDIPETNNINNINKFDEILKNIDDVENIDSVNNSFTTSNSYSTSYTSTYSNNYTQTY